MASLLRAVRPLTYQPHNLRLLITHTRSGHVLRNPFAVGFQRSFLHSETAGSAEALAKASSTPSSVVVGALPTDTIDPAPTLETAQQILTNAAHQIGDLHQLGLGSYYTPAGLLQNGLELLHVGGLPWYAAIVVATISLRTLLLPLGLRVVANTAKTRLIQPQLDEISKDISKATKEGEDTSYHTVRRQQLLKKHGINSVLSIVYAAVNIPVFITFFYALRRMSSFPVESMKEGGPPLLWLHDLTVPDPYYVLPIISTTLALLSVELGSEGTPQQRGPARWIFRGLTVIILYVSVSMPQAIFWYWIPSSIMSLLQLVALRIKAIRRMLKIPEMAQPVKLSSFKFSLSPAKAKASFQNSYKSFVDWYNDLSFVPQAKLVKMKNEKLQQDAVKMGPPAQTFINKPSRKRLPPSDTLSK